MVLYYYTNWKGEKRIKKKREDNINNTKVHVSMPKELYKQFKEKCDEIGLAGDVIIKGLIEEWIY